MSVFDRTARTAGCHAAALNALLDQWTDRSVSEGLVFRWAEGQRVLQELYEARVAAISAPPPPVSSQDGEGG